MMDAFWPGRVLSALDHPALWEWQIRNYERRDRRHTPLLRGVLFAGSSSIRLWTSLAADMAPLPVLSRGFGGAHLDHVIHYADRIVLPYQPRLIALYAGENDLSGWSKKNAVTIAADFEHFVEIVHGELPDTRILYLSVKPSPLRKRMLDQQNKLNELIRELTSLDRRLGYVDMAGPLLDAGGQPRSELFRLDRLHLNQAGYRAWMAQLRPILQDAWAEITRGD